MLPYQSTDIQEKPQRMRWVASSLKNSMFAMLGKGSDAYDAAKSVRLERLRATMLGFIDDRHIAGKTQFAQMLTRIQRADSAEDLWYLRADLMGLLSLFNTETQARQLVDSLNPQFRCLLPASMMRQRRR